MHSVLCAIVSVVLHAGIGIIQKLHLSQTTLVFCLEVFFLLLGYHFLSPRTSTSQASGFLWQTEKKKKKQKKHTKEIKSDWTQSRSVGLESVRWSQSKC